MIFSAKEVAIFGCDSQVLADQYASATFIGVDPGQSGGITTGLGSAQGADFLKVGGGQAGVDAANADVLSSQDPRDTGANVELNRAQPSLPPPDDEPSQLPESD